MSRTQSRREITSFHSRTVQFNDTFGLYPNGKPCFVCGRILRDAVDEPTLFTRVAAGIVFFHSTCAVELGERLVQEGTRAELESAEGPHTDLQGLH
jgi:hypothetical protein